MNEQPSSGNVQSDSGSAVAAPEMRIDGVSPPGNGELELAGRGARLGAAIIDGVLVAVATVVSSMVLGYNMFTSGATPTFGFQVVFTIGYIAWYAIINGHLLNKNGQTVGKKLLGIKIVRTNGDKADLVRLVGLRLAPISFAGLIPYLGNLIGIVDVLCIFRENRKCLHDNIADTIVVKA